MLCKSYSAIQKPLMSARFLQRNICCHRKEETTNCDGAHIIMWKIPMYISVDPKKPVDLKSQLVLNTAITSSTCETNQLPQWHQTQQRWKNIRV